MQKAGFLITRLISYKNNKDADFFVLFLFRFNVPVNNFLSHVGTEPPFPGYYQYFRGVKCLAQGHNTAEVGFEPPTSRSGV